ncbi:hypothetical protein Ae201684P_000444 [Aphanomyces euteiches]|uniref:Uncharacterized protein n=1 Tax=Aphanomyces euteiches TaxID=100861 RepID=A0A6G0XR86_9STRA|nr:hypothetical protein Ae201684_002121 [Aphanomyces euteiches]KAH9087030.1 hypothetical protein Ae201684P_000444 [Aphanomyces euteiches]KAH9145210.1 hypothetical protein AeRB84_010843 [Aphanomyces euteiches]
MKIILVLSVAIQLGGVVESQSNFDIGVVTSAPTTTNGACVAASLISSVEATNGVALFSDQLCATDPTNCVAQTYCRKCKVFDSLVSSNYASCPPAAYPSVPRASQVYCQSYVFPDEATQGISAIYDAQCPVTGGTGCVSSGAPCRRCLLNLTSAQDLHPCELNTCLPSAVVNLQGAVGVLDSRCYSSPSLAGCIPSTSCRLCRLDKNEANAYLDICATVLWTKKSAEVSVQSTADSNKTWPELNVNLSSLTERIEDLSDGVGQTVLGSTVAHGVILASLIAVLAVVAICVAVTIYWKCVRSRASLTAPEKIIVMGRKVSLVKIQKAEEKAFSVVV